MELFIVRKVLEANAKTADEIRQKMIRSNTLLVNIMSSPGSGKTALLENLIPSLQKKGIRVGVVEGDITTTCDAKRLQPLNVPISQINTELFGGDCHLCAEVILPALEPLDLEKMDIIFIENVGNLVCPAEFDTGAALNVVLLSVTEGEDKPLKYPLMFRVCQYAFISKIDLLPFLDFDLEFLKSNILKINPKITISQISSITKEGIDEFGDQLIRFCGKDNIAKSKC
ncbi:MAG: hydrogenase accessory protein HypB [Candidatus Marinimicrobia bacterium CG08_land_8_20_14_0_20_45_22]|nr:MAG: hydrogenase accessory protein HypB [Candidatus Marinimicrobia bacterium CG08_land_8_20_14_0_20_45_22]